MDISYYAADDAARRAIEHHLHRLVGRRIEAVRYVEVHHEGLARPTWRGAIFDSLDFGLEFDLDDGATWSVIWKQQDANEGLLVYPGTLVPTEICVDAHIAIWDATAHWHGRGPVTISRVTPVWTRHQFGPATDWTGHKVAEAGESDLCFETLILTAADGREAVISLGERDVNGRFQRTATNVAIFFARSDAHDARVLMPGDADATSPQADSQTVL